MTRRTLPILLLLALCAAWAAGPASAARKLTRHEQMVVDLVENQRLDACKYTTEQLKKAKSAVPLDAQQYNAALIAAFDDAIAARAQGACNKSKPQQQPTQAAAPVAPPIAGPQPPPPPATSGTPHDHRSRQPSPRQPQQAQPAPTPQCRAGRRPRDRRRRRDRARRRRRPTSSPRRRSRCSRSRSSLGVLALCTLAFGIVRWFAWEPAWAVRFRHAAGEAGWRASSTWADFTDYVRLGR